MMKQIRIGDQPEISLSITQINSLVRLQKLDKRPSLGICYKALGGNLNTLDERFVDLKINRVYFGSEYCDRLIPSSKEMDYALTWSVETETPLTLVTPIVTDSGCSRLADLLQLLPPKSEVVVNDWGILHQMKRDHESLVPILGRMLNKMVKDPRLPDQKWAKLHPADNKSIHTHSFLKRYGIEQIEMDIPPFTKAEQFECGDMGLTVHLPYGYTVKGRMCRIGSLGLSDGIKFKAGHPCQKECLTYWTELERLGSDTSKDLTGFQRGNTQFYRYSTDMTDELCDALKQHWIKRLVFAGDWNENYLPAE